MALFKKIPVLAKGTLIFLFGHPICDKRAAKLGWVQFYSKQGASRRPAARASRGNGPGKRTPLSLCLLLARKGQFWLGRGAKPLIFLNKVFLNSAPGVPPAALSRYMPYIYPVFPRPGAGHA